MAQAVGSATLDFLTWVSSRPRTYDETMAAWRTSCPRLSIWEDALADGLVRVVRGSNGVPPAVALTPHGRDALTPIRS
jgi:hypothetical protein